MAQSFTIREVKARFSKRHLVKLVKEMLTWTTPDGHGNNIQMLTLRSGWTPERIAESVGLESATDVVWQKGCYNYHTIDVVGYWVKCANNGDVINKYLTHKPIKFHIDDSDGFGVWGGPSYDDSNYKRYLDNWIMGCLMRHDQFFRDNSAIPIAI